MNQESIERMNELIDILNDANYNYYVKDNPNAAQILNGIGLGFGVVGFISSTLLIKVNTKLENIDNYILSQQHR